MESVYRSLAGLIILLPVIYNVIRMAIMIISGLTGDAMGLIILIPFSVIVSYVKPCKSTIANLSFSYHSMMLTFLALVYYLWKHDLSIPTEKLELTFILLPLTSHILVAIWAGYRLTLYIRGHCGYQLNFSRCRLALAIKCCFQRERVSYQELN